jgi:hypothetical protein
MAISEPFELDGVTIGATEYSIPAAASYHITTTTQTADGVYQLWIDAGVMAKADEFRVRLYETVEATGGTKKVFAQWTLLGVQTEIFVTPTFILINGWDFTLQKISGTDRAFDASIRKVA